MSVAEMGWDAAQTYWRDAFDREGFVGVRLLTGIYYLRRREVGETILLADPDVAPSKLAWMLQSGIAEGIRS